MFFFTLGVLRNLCNEKQETEYLTFKKISFKAVIKDYKIIDNEIYLLLENFENYSFMQEKHLVQEFAFFPKTALMKIKNIDNVNFNCNSSIKAVGRFYFTNKPIFQEKLERQKNIGIIYDYEIVNSKKTIKDFLRLKINQFENNSKQIIQAIFLGDSYVVEKNIRNSFVKIGLGHVLGVSVLNISLFLYLFYIFFYYLLSKFLFLTKYSSLKNFANLLSLIFIFIYCYLLGFDYPLLRSLIISFINLFSFIIGNNRKEEILFLTSSIILWIWPEAIFDIGFQLSFLGVLVIYLFYTSLIKNYILNNVYLTGMVSFFTLPIIIYNFNQFCVQPFLGNILIVPLITFILIPLINIWVLLSFFNLEFLLTKLIEFIINIIINLTYFLGNFSYIKFLPIISYKIVLFYVISLFLFAIFKKYIFIIIGYLIFIINLFYSYNQKEYILVTSYGIAYVKNDKIYLNNNNEYLIDILKNSLNKEIITSDFVYFIKHGSNYIVLNKYYVIYNYSNILDDLNYEMIESNKIFKINL